MLQCFEKAQAYPEACRAFSKVLKRKGLVQIADENRSGRTLSGCPDGRLTCT